VLNLLHMKRNQREGKTMKSAIPTSMVAALVASVLLAAGCATASSALAQAPATVSSGAGRALAPQTDQAGGVTVKVTPRNLGRNAAVWEFAVVLDTHTQDLSQDLTRSAVLVDALGARHLPLGWEGAAPGGHHREGVLKFKPLAPEAQAVALEISGIGGTSVRTFRWQLR
jgi:uncharacterized membrane protein